MDNARLLPGVGLARLASLASMAAAGQGDGNCNRRLGRDVDLGGIRLCGPKLAAGSSDPAGLLASGSVRPACESGVPDDAAEIRSEAASGIHSVFDKECGAPILESRARICVSILLSTRAVRPGCTVLNGYGPFCGGVLEHCRSARLCVLRDVSICSDASPASNRKCGGMAAATVENSHAEFICASSCQHSSQHLSKRARRSEPCNCTGTHAISTNHWLDFSLLRDRHRRRGGYRPVSLRCRCVVGNGARGRFLLDSGWVIGKKRAAKSRPSQEWGDETLMWNIIAVYRKSDPLKTFPPRERFLAGHRGQSKVFTPLNL